MSEPDLLPPDLAELERRLSHRPLTDPSATLRSHVLMAVRRQLGRFPQWTGWQFAAAMLLVGMVGGNLILATAGSAADRLGRRGLDPGEAGATAGRLRAMLLETPVTEGIGPAWLVERGAGRRPLAPPADGDPPPTSRGRLPSSKPPGL